jgi:hypothetical protein
MAQTLSAKRRQELRDAYPAQTERLDRQAEQKSEVPEMNGSPEVPSDLPGGPAEDPYADLTRDELYAEVKSRNISGMSQANVDDLRAALRADDAA